MKQLWIHTKLNEQQLNLKLSITLTTNKFDSLVAALFIFFNTAMRGAFAGWNIFQSFVPYTTTCS